MAKPKPDTNKSDAILAALAKTPTASAKDIQAALAAKGIKVTSSLVYFVRSRTKLAAKKQRHKRRVERVAQATGTGDARDAQDAVQLIRKVKELAAEVGGLNKLRELLDILA